MKTALKFWPLLLVAAVVYWWWSNRSVAAPSAPTGSPNPNGIPDAATTAANATNDVAAQLAMMGV